MVGRNILIRSDLRRWLLRATYRRARYRVPSVLMLFVSMHDAGTEPLYCLQFSFSASRRPLTRDVGVGVGPEPLFDSVDPQNVLSPQ